MGLRIVVEKRDELTTRRLHADVASACEAFVRGRNDEVDVGSGGMKAIGTVIAGAVLDHHDLQLVLGPIKQSELPDRFNGVGGAPKIHKNNRDDTGTELRHADLSHGGRGH